MDAVREARAAVLKSNALLVDECPLFRVGLRTELAREPDLQVTVETGDPHAAIEIARTTSIDVAVIDVLAPMTAGMSPLALIRDLRDSCRVLVLSALDDPYVIATSLRAGAAGYALKSQPAAQIIDAIRTVLVGRRYLPPHVAPRAIEQLQTRDQLTLLTSRERTIFDLVVHGHTTHQIAVRLFVEPRTVETHRYRIMKKLATHSCLELVQLAARTIA